MTTRRKGVWFAAGLVAGLAALNAVGVLRYPGGPLREQSADGLLWLDIRPADQGSSRVSNSQPSDWAITGRSYFYGLLTIRNATPFTATLESVTPVDPTDGLVVDAIYVLRPGAPHAEVTAFGPSGSFPDQATLQRDFARLPAQIAADADPPGAAPQVVVVISSNEPGAFGFTALAIDYRIGPLTFRAIHHLELAGCLGPLPSGTACPEEE